MNKRIALIFTLFLAHCWVVGQDSLVTWGETFKIDKSEKLISIVGVDNERFYTTKNLRATAPNFILECYDRESLERVFSKSVDLPQIGDETTRFEDIFYLNGQFLLFSTFYDKEADNRRAYCTIMDNQGQWLDLPKQVDDLYVKQWNASEYKFTFSQDSSLFMIYHDRPFNRNSSENFAFKVYNTSLELLWEKRLELPYGEEAFQITDYHLDNNGNVFMLSGSTQEKIKDELLWKQLRKKKYVLLAYDWKKNKLTEFDVSLKGKWIIAVTSGLDDRGNISIGGFYSNDQYFTIAGSFFFSLDTRTKEVTAKGLMAFDKDQLSQFMKEKRVEKGKELSNFYFDHLVLHDDGTALMVAEQFNVTERVTNDPSTGRQVVTNFYNYGDLLAVKVNGDGSIKWAKRIPKRQSVLSDLRQYAGYSIAEQGDDIFLLYNDHPSNFEILKEDPDADLVSFTNIKKAVAKQVKIDRDGQLTYKPLFSLKDSETVLRPELFLNDHDDLIIYGQYRREYRFGKVQLR